MELKEAQRQHQKKANRSKTIRTIWQKLIIILIGYPIVFPLEKFKEWRKVKQKEYWSLNLTGLQEKCFREMMIYIEKDMMGDDSYCIYNAHCHEEIRFGDAFYLRDFVGSGFWRYRTKVHKWSYLYYELRKSSGFREEEFYAVVFQTLKSRLKSKYEDIQMQDGNYRTYEYVELSLKDAS